MIISWSNLHKNLIFFLTLVWAWSYVLIIYYFPGSRLLNLLDVAVFSVCILFSLVATQRFCSFRLSFFGKVLLLFLSYVALHSLFFGVFNDNSDLLLRGLRFALLLSSVLFLDLKCIEDRAKKLFLGIGILVSWFLIFQYVFLFLGFGFLPGYLPYLDLVRPELISHSNAISSGADVRLRSFLGEPSQIGLVAGLSFILGASGQFGGWRSMLVISLALVLSFSAASFGIFVFGACVFCFIFMTSRHVYTTWAAGIVLGVISLIVLFWVFRHESFHELLFNYSFRANRRLEGLFVGPSLGDLSAFTFLFGHGAQGNFLFEGWSSGILRIFVYYGFIGVFLYFLIPLSMLILKADLAARLIGVLTLVLSFVSEMGAGPLLGLYLAAYFVFRGKREADLLPGEAFYVSPGRRF